MASSDGQHGGLRLKPLPAAIAGVVVGAVLVAAMVAAGIPHRPDRTEVAASSEGPEAARAFLATWRRSRLASWVVEATFTRSGNDGRQLSVDVYRAQRPPDRLSSGLGSVNARRGDVELVCGGGERGPESLRCREGRALVPYEQEVEDELRILGQYVLGSDALYAVRQEGEGCFRLRLRFELPSPPYGRLAIFCFDHNTAAPTLAEIQRDEGTDVTRADRVSGEPRDQDLAPPAPDRS